MNETCLLISLLQNATSVAKILHWRTRSFAQHIALDELIDGLREYTDKLAETAIGIEPTILDGLANQTWGFSESYPLVFIDELWVQLNELADPVGEKHDALETIMDDLLADVAKVKYKLTQLN